MFSWCLFNCLIIATSNGSPLILGLAMLINLIAWIEHKARHENYGAENTNLANNVKKLTTRKYRKDL